MPANNEHNWLPSPVAGADERYLAVRRAGLARVREFDEVARQYEPLRAFVQLRRHDVRATSTARTIWLLDREIRRAAHILQQRSYYGLPAPLNTDDAGLEIKETHAGSLEFVLEPYGAVRDLLLSDPMQLTVTAFALLGGVRRVVGRLQSPEPPQMPDPEEDGRLVTVDIPGHARVSAPADAEVHVLLPGGGEIHIGRGQ